MKSSPFSEETPFPEISDDPFAGLKPADPFAGLRASSTSPHRAHVTPERRLRREPWRPGTAMLVGMGLLLGIAIVLALGILLWPTLEERFAGADEAAPPVSTPVVEAPTSASAADITSALLAAGHTGVTVAVDGGRASLSGKVSDEAELGAVTSLVMAQPGVTSLDNQLEIAADPALTAEQLTAAAADALAAAGFARVSVEVEAGVATLGGFVPINALEDGFFSYVQRAEDAVLRIEGIDSVTSQIGIKGNAAQLRDQLRQLTDATPIVFESGSAALTAESAGVLDEVASAIIGQPGLQVFIAGHTDTVGSAETNEALARGRAGAVFQYLAQRGVPVNRMFVVAYGELFPDAEDAAASRRIEFEVGG